MFTLTMQFQGEATELYEALSMYLLKNGKWKIPKEAFSMFKKTFSFTSIKYIYEKVMRLKQKYLTYRTIFTQKLVYGTFVHRFG